MDTVLKIAKLATKLAERESASPTADVPKPVYDAIDAALVHLRHAAFADSRLDRVIAAVSAVVAPVGSGTRAYTLELRTGSIEAEI